MNTPPRSTTPQPGDVSRGRPGASTEAALFSGYRNARVRPRYRREPCVCGLEIRAEIGWEAAAVDEHNATLEHQAWRARKEAQERAA
jgi:hypothetical protein